MQRFLFVLIITLSVSARAETVFLTDGQVVEGPITWRGNAGVAVHLDLEPDVFIDANRITGIETSEQTAARKAKLREEAEFLEQMKAEGRTLYNGEWVTLEEREADEARIKAESEEVNRAAAAKDARFADEQRAKGLVPYYGRWVTPDQRDELRAQALEKQGAAKTPKTTPAKPATPFAPVPPVKNTAPDTGPRPQRPNVRPLNKDGTAPDTTRRPVRGRAE